MSSRPRIPTSVTVSFDSRVPVGLLTDVSVVAHYDSPVSVAAKLTSSDESVIAVEGNQLFPISAGTAVISATYRGVTGTGVITVTDAPLVSITVTPPNAVVQIGTPQQMTSIGTFSDLSTYDLTTRSSWFSSSETICTISSTGLVTGLQPGSANIISERHSIIGSTPITVIY